LPKCKVRYPDSRESTTGGSLPRLSFPSPPNPVSAPASRKIRRLITRDQTSRLSDKEAGLLRSYIADPDFWQPRDEGDRILGGTRWLFELQDSSGYHVVSVFSPVLFLGDQEVGERAYHWTPAQKRIFRREIQVATLLLRATKIFPDELTVQE